MYVYIDISNKYISIQFIGVRERKFIFCLFFSAICSASSLPPPIFSIHRKHRIYRSSIYKSLFCVCVNVWMCLCVFVFWCVCVCILVLICLYVLLTIGKYQKTGENVHLSHFLFQHNILRHSCWFLFPLLMWASHYSQTQTHKVYINTYVYTHTHIHTMNTLYIYQFKRLLLFSGLEGTWPLIPTKTNNNESWAKPFYSFRFSSFCCHLAVFGYKFSLGFVSVAFILPKKTFQNKE